MTDERSPRNERQELLGGHSAGGLRRSPFYVLNDDEIEFIKSEIQAIKADVEVFHFNEGLFTQYVDESDVILINGNIFPDVHSLHPRDIMSVRAVLAHEYYGHRAFRGTSAEPQSWNDEFRASYSAAKNAPNLSDEDRRYLVLDALERTKEAGIKIKSNSFIRSVLYGYQ